LKLLIDSYGIWSPLTRIEDELLFVLEQRNLGNTHPSICMQLLRDDFILRPLGSPLPTLIRNLNYLNHVIPYYIIRPLPSLSVLIVPPSYPKHQNNPQLQPNMSAPIARAATQAGKAAAKSAEGNVLNKGAKRDPELYV